VYEYAVGHGVATNAALDAGGQCREVSTCWIPSAEVERVAPAPIPDVECSMEALAQIADGAEARTKMMPLVTHYRQWIESQRAAIPSDPPARAQTGAELIDRAEAAAARIESGIHLLGDPVALDAFKTANRVMAVAARRRFGAMQGKDPVAVPPPAWRPFQLAFILMNLEGIASPAHLDRGIVDLLFFPTGGGKTEAYLGLAAFTLVLRRLRNPGISSAGLSVLMRYTLRLLTLDQLGRAATLICALELERQKNPEKLGPWPFEIGLWVGKTATPNRMGSRNDGDSESARAKTIAYKNDDRKPSPIPLEECPWCGEKFTRNSFQLLPSVDTPTDLRVLCVNRNCDFTRDRALPILSVDEPIYRRLPCFMIATVDKFAAMPWTGEVGMFFGGAERHDKHGFYGPCTPGRGTRLEKPLLPPDLVIQDELHLISGPLGTMVGLYETVLDELCARTMGDTVIRPKIVASTATVRRAEKQIQALFNRRMVEVFPPPGLDRRDSYFARTHSPQESNARLYVGIAAQGRSLKVVLLRTYLALLGAAQKAYKAAGDHRNKNNPADPYMTLLGYFNSLRELGGSRRIIEDEVSTRLTGYANRKREGEQDGLFENRKITYEVVELTSRISTDKVAEAKRKLARPFYENDRVDVAIATNMISVGLDIVRLGLMVVLGQPKTSAEYIQATSRVGRDPERPGLVVTLLNIHRPRDRSHYERFTAYHESFYRSVEATSVTPFSPRALDRGMAGAAIGLARLRIPSMTPPRGAAAIQTERGALGFVAEAIAARAAAYAAIKKEEPEALRDHVKNKVNDLLDTWEQIAADFARQGVSLQYQRELGAAQRLLYDFLDPDLKILHPRHRKFRANRSMRDVEPSVNLWVKTLDNVDLEAEDL
ncbi:MAG TPA: helicase, partial [Candidatus Hydrogenedentes bacterium]|nr:helicase [Candidatus Hydrogenedentota bacterium]